MKRLTAHTALRRLRSTVERIPIAMAGLALGLASLGNLLGAYSTTARWTIGGLATAILIGVLIRLVLNPSSVRSEAANPAVFAVVPTFFMATMLLSTYIAPYAYLPALGIWILALTAQLAVVGLFTWRHVRRFQMSAVLPSWFVMYVGYVVGAVTSPVYGAESIGGALLAVGLAAYLIVLPTVYYRLIRHGRPDEPIAATLGILIAPSSLALVGYLSVAEHPQVSLIYGLLAMSLVSLVVVLTQLWKLVCLPFYPSCSALTFPFVITAIAVRSAGAALGSANVTAGAGWIAASALPVGTVLRAVAPFTDVLAVVMVAWATVRYARYLADDEGAASACAAGCVTRNLSEAANESSSS